MNSEVKESTRIIKVINEHLAESDCHHNIKSIMQQALDSKAVGLNQSPTADADDINNPEPPGDVYTSG